MKNDEFNPNENNDQENQEETQNTSEQQLNEIVETGSITTKGKHLILSLIHILMVGIACAMVWTSEGSCSGCFSPCWNRDNVGINRITATQIRGAGIFRRITIAHILVLEFDDGNIFMNLVV